MPTGYRDDLQINEDPEFQRRIWAFQRIGWVLLILLIGAALAGFLGRGPLSARRAGAPGRAWIEYEGFAQAGAETRFTFLLEPGPDGVARLVISRQLLDRCSIESATPQPRATEIRPDGLELSYAVPVEMDEATAALSVRPRHPGAWTGWMSQGQRRAAVRQWVYP